MDVFYKKAVLKNFATFTEKRLCWSFFLIKIQAFWPATFLKKRLQHRLFSCENCEILRAPLFLYICKRLLLLRKKSKPAILQNAIFLRVKFRIIYCVKNIAQTICTNKVASFSFTEDWICYAHRNFILLFLCGMSIVQRVFPAILLNVNLLKTASHKTVKGVKVWLSHSKSFFASTLKILLFIDTVKSNFHCLQFKQAN